MQEEFYDIEFDGCVRREVKENTNECLGIVYTFDELGRIRKYVQTDYGDLEEAEYWYEETEQLPWKIVKSEFWERGMAVQVSEIRYLETDSLGNWLRREVKNTTKEVDYEAADSVFTKQKHVESCVNKYSKVVASSLIETQSIGLRESIPIIIKQKKGFSVWQYGLIGGGICLVVGIVFYFWKKNKKNQV